MTRTVEVKSAWGSMTSESGSFFLSHFAAFSPTTLSFKSFEAQGDLQLEISREPGAWRRQRASLRTTCHAKMIAQQPRSFLKLFSAPNWDSDLTSTKGPARPSEPPPKRGAYIDSRFGHPFPLFPSTSSPHHEASDSI